MATRKLSSTTRVIEFSHLEGREFERLVFAYAARRWLWSTLNWRGQRGADGGRDIEGLRVNDRSPNGEVVVFACANWRSLTISKAKDDLASMSKLGAPDLAVIVAGGSVSAKARDAIGQESKSLGISAIEVWSGAEFEERLRLDAPGLVKRFFDGEQFPDDPSQLVQIGRDAFGGDDASKLQALRRIFERPAFETPIHQESSIPDFHKAIADTIEALNTGLYRSRDGSVIGRVPSRYDFEAKALRVSLKSVVESLNQLRIEFDRGLREGGIRPCGCGQLSCPVLMVDSSYQKTLEHYRTKALREFEATAA